jgi:hypothetical protein
MYEDTIVDDLLDGNMANDFKIMNGLYVLMSINNPLDTAQLGCSDFDI